MKKFKKLIQNLIEIRTKLENKKWNKIREEKQINSEYNQKARGYFAHT